MTAADFNWTEGWDGLPFKPLPQWVVDAVEAGVLVPGTPRNTDYSEWRVTTLEGEHWGTPGDWLIRGVKGEMYFCKPDIFAATYEPAATAPRSEGDGAGDAPRERLTTRALDIADGVSDAIWGGERGWEGRTTEQTLRVLRARLRSTGEPETRALIDEIANVVQENRRLRALMERWAERDERAGRIRRAMEDIANCTSPPATVEGLRNIAHKVLGWTPVEETSAPEQKEPSDE